MCITRYTNFTSNLMDHNKVDDSALRSNLCNVGIFKIHKFKVIKYTYKNKSNLMVYNRIMFSSIVIAVYPPYKRPNMQSAKTLLHGINYVSITWIMK